MPAETSAPLASHRPGEILVMFDNASASLRAEVLAAVGGKLAERLGDDAPEIGHGVERVLLGAGVSVEKAIEILSRQPGVKFAEPDYEVSATAISNDPDVLAGKTWGLYGDVGLPVNIYGSQASEAWAAGYTGSTKVAAGVIDTGIDYTHPDLYLNIWLNQKEIPTALKANLRDVDADGLITFRDLNNSQNASYVADKNANGRIDAGDLLADTRWENGVDDDGNSYRDDLIGWDFVNNDNDPMDDHGHGTHVAGTISATGGNGVGVAGVSWSTQLVALKFLDNTSYGYVSNATLATDYFTNASKAGTGVDFAATNNSWGGAGASATLNAAIVRGANEEILFVAAAANGGSDRIGDNNDTTPNYPSNASTLSAAGYEAVIAVASIDKFGALASYSNYGRTTVDLGAPGHSIFSTKLGGGYGYMSGTSMATPHVTGAIALYSAAAPGATAAQIRADLLGTTISTASLVNKTVTGGRLNVDGLLDKLGGAGGDDGGDGGGGPIGAILGTILADLITPTSILFLGPKPTAGADTVQGLAGNDTLDGGAGADVLEGGSGSDNYYVDNAGDVVLETLSGSTGGSADKVTSSVTFTLGTNVERLTLSGTADVDGTGNSLANVLYGNAGDNQLSGAAGADTLDGNGGADTLRGGAGADRLTGDAGVDRFVFAKGDIAGDTIVDFTEGELIQLTGYSAGSTVTKVSGSATDWKVTDGATGATEVFHLSNGHSLSAGDFLFA